MDGNIRFFNYSRTVNEDLILSFIEGHGEYVTHLTESVLVRRFMDWDGVCYLADILTIFRKGERDFLIGIEIKDWKKAVHPNLCWTYLKTYRRSCEYFYLAARKISPTAFMIDNIGLINLSRMKVVKRAKYLHPSKEYRASVVKIINRYSKVRRNIIEDPYQISLDRFM